MIIKNEILFIIEKNIRILFTIYLIISKATQLTKKNHRFMLSMIAMYTKKTNYSDISIIL